MLPWLCLESPIVAPSINPLGMLLTVESGTLFGIVFIVLTSLSGFLHLIVWRKSHQMLFTFIPHLLLNLVPIIWTHYSILPFLFRSAAR